MISPETIALVRERTNIVAVLQESVPSLKKRGRSFVGLCPFHKEKTPSFHVNPDRGFFHCFGCKESGSAIDFLMKNDGLTFPEAVRALADRCGIEVVEDRGGASPNRSEVDRQKKHKDDLLSVMNVAATFYERQLREHADRAYAIEELQKRALEETHDVIQQFRMGYAPAAWDTLAQHLKAHGLSPALAEEVGLLVPRSSGGGHYDRFRHRLMFSVMDTQGRVVAFSGRALREITKEPDKDPPPKYVNSPESPIYTKGNLLFGLFQARHAIRREDTAVLVEGNFDVVSLHARGLEHVVAPLGTAFTEEQARLLHRYASRVVICFDGDAAGRKATRASRGACGAAGLAARVAMMPHGTDPDALARDKGIDAVKDAIAQARGIVEFLIDDLLDESFNAADGSEKTARVQAVATILGDEEDPLLRATLKQRVDSLAGRLDLVRREESARGEHSPDAFRALEAAVKRIAAQRRAPAQKLRPGEVSAPPGRARYAQGPGLPGLSAMYTLVGAVIEFPELLQDSEMAVATELLGGDAAKAVALVRTFSSESGTKVYATEFLSRLDEPLRSFAAKHFAGPKYETPAEAKTEALLAASQLRRILVEQETAEISSEQRRNVDFEEQKALASEVARKQRERRGLK
ncbi:MAG TPA: DNA primase [Polyangiaceae bacterium]|jgi:DNA primase